MWQIWMGWKMSSCKWYTFWIVPCLLCYFIVILFYIERKWLLMRNLVTILPLKFKLSGKFQRFNAIERSIEMLKNSWISKKSIKMKNCKTFYKAQTVSLKKTIQPFPPAPTRQNFTTSLEQKDTFAFKVLQEFKSWASRNGAVQMLFLTLNRKRVARKFVTWERFLAVLPEHIIFNVK